MRRYVFVCAFSLLLLSSCFQAIEELDNDIDEHTFIDFEIHYAKGFSLKQTQDKTYVLIHDPSSGLDIDTLDISGQKPGHTLYFSKLIVQSTTHFAFLKQIDAVEKLVGLCGVHYLNEAQKSELIACHEICHAQGLDIEKVVDLRPDLVFLYPFGDQDKTKLNRLGIQTVYLTEYLENSPLARAEWLKFYALITGQDPNLSGFENLEREYLSLVQEKRPTEHTNPSDTELKVNVKEKNKANITRPNSVAFNLPYGDSWDMPSENSISGNLVRDAGLTYFLDQEKKQGNLLFKIEEAYNHLSQADYWVIIAARPAHFSLKDLLAENRVYKTFPSVRSKHVFFCNTETTPYFSEAPTEPHLLLKDLIACLNGTDSSNTYFRILK